MNNFSGTIVVAQSNSMTIRVSPDFFQAHINISEKGGSFKEIYILYRAGIPFILTECWAAGIGNNKNYLIRAEPIKTVQNWPADKFEIIELNLGK